MGNGLIDMICPPDRVDAFIDLCGSAGISIRGFTWWCHVTNGHPPCGMGGPRSEYRDGWSSEIPTAGIIRLAGNGACRDFFSRAWPADKGHHGC